MACSNYPSAVWFILGSEVCERFSYYGLRAILVIYLVEIGFSETAAISLFSCSTFLSHVLPLLGGYIADSKLGKYKTILIFSIIYISGSITLSLSTIGRSIAATCIGIFLIACGTGGIKPCVAPFGGDQFIVECNGSESDARARRANIDSFFGVFYFAINLGSVFSFIVTPLLRRHVGYFAAFGVPSILLSAAIIVFWAGRKRYVKVEPAGSPLHTIFLAITKQYSRLTERQIEDSVSLLQILPILLFMPIFWALWDQQSSAWVLQASRMKLQIPLFGSIQPEQMGIVNPLLIILLAPLYTRLLMKVIEPLQGAGAGLVLSSIAFLIAGHLQYWIDDRPDGTISVLWQLPQIVILSCAEILVTINVLSYTYASAPKNMESMVFSANMLSIALGAAFISSVYAVFGEVVNQMILFYAFSFIMMIDFILYVYFLIRFKILLFEQESTVRDILQSRED